MAPETGVETSSKLTLKVLGCDPKAVLKLPEHELPIARVYGNAFRVGVQNDVEHGQSYTYFTGMFEGVNMQDGSIVQAPRLYLPGSISDMVENVINQAQARDKQARVGFIVEIRAVKSREAKGGYIYKGVFLQKPELQDELAKFREQGQAGMEKLAKQKKSA